MEIILGGSLSLNAQKALQYGMLIVSIAITLKILCVLGQ
jgi:hypothetical protein